MHFPFLLGCHRGLADCLLWGTRSPWDAGKDKRQLYGWQTNTKKWRKKIWKLHSETFIHLIFNTVLRVFCPSVCLYLYTKREARHISCLVEGGKQFCPAPSFPSCQRLVVFLVYIILLCFTVITMQFKILKNAFIENIHIWKYKKKFHGKEKRYRIKCSFIHVSSLTAFNIAVKLNLEYCS